MATNAKNQGWSDAYHVLDFYAESEFACNNGGCIRESQMITVYVRGVYLPGFRSVSSHFHARSCSCSRGRRMTGAKSEEGSGENPLPACDGSCQPLAMGLPQTYRGRFDNPLRPTRITGISMSGLLDKATAAKDARTCRSRQGRTCTCAKKIQRSVEGFDGRFDSSNF